MDLKHPTTKLPQTPPHSLLTFPNNKTHVAYKECLKNHAVGIGRYAVDGCGEFMALEPSSFQCAACGCHRSFHRRELISYHIPTHAGAGASAETSTSPSLSPPPSPGHHLLLSLGTAAEHNHTPAPAPEVVKISGRKRFRTKFSPEQKQKMLNFAEKLGWKMQRCDDKMVADFCNEIGIRRRIFKVWMHNNKYTKKDTTATTILSATATATATATANNVSGDDGNQENGSSSSSQNR